MTNSKLVDLYRALSELKGLKGVKFNYGISKNFAILDSELNSIKAGLEVSDEYKLYDEKRVELCKEYSKKNESGEPMIALDQATNTTKYIIANQTGFDAALAELNKENKEIVDARTKQIEDFNQFLEKESTIALYKIKLEDVSPDITTEQMINIYPLIEE